MYKKKICAIALAVFALASVCAAALAKNHVWDNNHAGTNMKMGEFKLLLTPELFKGSRADGFRAAWSRVAEIAVSLGWTRETDDNLTGRLDEEVRVYTYPDTADGAFSARHYTLRQRIPVNEAGALDTDKADLTLKYTAKDGERVPVEAFMKGLPEGTKAKAEANVYGYVDKQAGKSVEHPTFQVTFKKQPVMTGTETVAWFAQKYPVIGTLGIPSTAVVSMSPSKYITSYAIEIGELKRGDVKLEVEACAWYNRETGAFVTAEVSWRGSLKDDDAIYELFDAIQRQAPDMLDGGKSKNAYVK